MTIIVRMTCLLLFFLFQPQQLSADFQTISIGVLAKSGEDIAVEKWSATADYLSTTLPEYHFIIVPLGFKEIHETVKQGKVDFVLTNPAFYVELEKLYGVSRIATLINQNLPKQQTTTFGGVIFTKADRQDINTLNDLKGKSFMAVDSLSFGGWIVAWREFFLQKIDPFTDFSSLHYAGTHERVVLAVLAGTIDAGTVRTDTLERMAEHRTIHLEQIKILNKQQVSDFPFLLSTALYPEWPMAAIKSTPDRLSRLVAGALMTMESAHPAALASQSAGWTIPLNYQPVHDCLFDLKLGPYKDYGKFSLADVLSRYWRQFTLLGLAVLLILATAWYVLFLNRILQKKKLEVDRLNITLESKVAQRTEKINSLLDQQIYLKGILQTVADINKLLITSPDLGVLLKKSCELFVQHGHYGFSWIGLLEQGEIYKIYSPDDFEKYLAPPPYAVNDQELPFYQSPTARCIREDTTVISDRNHDQDLTPWRDHAEIKGFQSAIALPLRARQSAPPLGTLTIYTWLREGFEQEEIAMLEELAGDLGFAISSFRHREEITRLITERTINYQETIFTFVNMIEQRDTYTAGHTERVAGYCQKIAQAMGIAEEEIEKLHKAAILHDIGKIATPDSVLLKPGKLNSLDYELIKLHATAGYEMLSNIDMYKDLAEIIHHHHERHDGQGYPDGLHGDEIPFLSRILTVADAFDAMTTNRIYKPRKEIKEALDELASLSGSQFNPEIVPMAIQALKETTAPVAVTQNPSTDIEKKRFSYFFNDKLTGLFNEDYLKVFLQNNQNLHEYTCLHILHLTNVFEYNKREGWEQGNRIFQDFAIELQTQYPKALIFRAYGNDFAILTRKHFDLEGDAFDCFTSIAGSEITVEPQHIDLKKDQAYTLDKLEKMVISGSIADTIKFPE
ncbi:MAG: PhnD/SsuA/transferrin family substrate-binding protein [Proteobacteria bacterium]|nr:PhnD/SsuA/transferrin family substrate-binding protein [Pseudomonadota bacterium]MBU1650404.1 PhnD/SsuA/transferrin family substrate-binding protein [Pseudomonadota bacterium]